MTIYAVGAMSEPGAVESLGLAGAGKVGAVRPRGCCVCAILAACYANACLSPSEPRSASASRPPASAASPQSPQSAASPSSVAQNHQPPAPRAATIPTRIGTTVFELPVPADYRDATAEFPGSGLDVVLAKGDATKPSGATIVIRSVPIAGGSFDEPKECAQTGQGLIRGGTDAPGTGGKLKSAQIIDGPVGKTCQIHLVAREGVALITELHRPGNSRSTPKDIWLMTCNYADGDTAAESACRFALSGFRFREP